MNKMKILRNIPLGNDYILFDILKRLGVCKKFLFPRQSTGKTQTNLPIIVHNIGNPEVNNKQYYYQMTVRILSVGCLLFSRSK